MKAYLSGTSIHCLAVSGLLLFSQAEGLSQINVGVNIISGGPPSFSSIAGGDSNTNDATMATIGGGYYNWIDVVSDWSFMGGGEQNYISYKSPYTVIGGGYGNTIWDHNFASFIGGGTRNAIAPNVFLSTIGGGSDNIVFQNYGTVGGGEHNIAIQPYATVGGGFGNAAVGPNSYVGGGTNNRAMDYAAIGGGLFNAASGRASVIGGGRQNVAIGDASTIGGGNLNVASNNFSAVGGGIANSSLAFASVVSGGSKNVAFGQNGTVAGGGGNVSSNSFSTAGGGLANQALSFGSTIPGGFMAQATNYSQYAYASGAFASPGDAQTSTYVLRRQTTATGWNELFLDGFSQRMHIAHNATWTFDVLVVGRSSTGDSAGYRFYGVIENVGGLTTFIAMPTNVVQGEDVPPWQAQVLPDNTNDSLLIRVTGSGTIRWVATARIVEVKF